VASETSYDFRTLVATQDLLQRLAFDSEIVTGDAKNRPGLRVPKPPNNNRKALISKEYPRDGYRGCSEIVNQSGPDRAGT